jgi:hypothetical protein
MPAAPAAAANPSSQTVCSVLCQYIGTESVNLTYVLPRQHLHQHLHSRTHTHFRTLVVSGKRRTTLNHPVVLCQHFTHVVAHTSSCRPHIAAAVSATVTAVGRRSVYPFGHTVAIASHLVVMCRALDWRARCGCAAAETIPTTALAASTAPSLSLSMHDSLRYTATTYLQHRHAHTDTRQPSSYLPDAQRGLCRAVSNLNLHTTGHGTHTHTHSLMIVVACVCVCFCDDRSLSTAGGDSSGKGRTTEQIQAAANQVVKRFSAQEAPTAAPVFVSVTWDAIVVQGEQSRTESL